MSHHVAYVLLGGAIGSLARYLAGAAVARSIGEQYPWGTTLVNLLGSFAFGFLFAAWQVKGGMPAAWRLLLLSGFLGGFTTFSNLMFEVASLLEGGRTTLAMVHLVVHNVLGLSCLMSGLWFGKAI